jgi:hypothetical protein
MQFNVEMLDSHGYYRYSTLELSHIAQRINYKDYVLQTLKSWLRYCATSRKVAGLIPDDVSGIFH